VLAFVDGALAAWADVSLAAALTASRSASIRRVFIGVPLLFSRAAPASSSEPRPCGQLHRL